MDKELNRAIKAARTMLKSAESPHSIGRPSNIYVICRHIEQNVYDCQFKIGQSIDPEIRLRQLSIHEKYRLSLIAWFPTDHADLSEYRLHVAYETLRVQDEWFALGRPDLNWFMNVSGFSHGTFYGYSQRISLPDTYWDGTISPFLF